MKVAVIAEKNYILFKQNIKFERGNKFFVLKIMHHKSRLTQQMVCVGVLKDNTNELICW